MIGPCAKTTVTCEIVATDGQRFVGTNYCNNAQAVCPRAVGEGYEKCTSICDQVGHAEVVAVALAGDNAEGATAYLSGHTYACQPCQEALFGAGVAFLSVGPNKTKDESTPLISYDDESAFTIMTNKPRSKNQ
jgi:pyrimidine deaminase RibD-like protein